MMFFFFFQAEDGIRDKLVTGVQTCALPIWSWKAGSRGWRGGAIPVLHAAPSSTAASATWPGTAAPRREPNWPPWTSTAKIGAWLRPSPQPALFLCDKISQPGANFSSRCRLGGECPPGLLGHDDSPYVRRLPHSIRTAGGRIRRTDESRLARIHTPGLFGILVSAVRQKIGIHGQLVTD